MKKTNLGEYANPRKGGVIGIKIEQGDRLIGVKLTNGNNEIVLVTKDGMSIRFDEEQARDMGRGLVGNWGIRLSKGDYVIGVEIVDINATLLVAGEHGIGKRTPFDEYRVQSRGGKGIITMKTTDKVGSVVGALSVTDTDEIMLTTSQGQPSARTARISASPAATPRASNLSISTKATNSSPSPASSANSRKRRRRWQRTPRSSQDRSATCLLPSR